MQATIEDMPGNAFSFRALGSITLGVLITFGLFVLMAKLIEQDRVEVKQPQTVDLGQITLKVDEPNTITKTKIKPMEKPVTPPPRLMPNADPTPNDVISDFPLTPGNTMAKVKIDTNMGGGITDGEATPIFRVNSTYPSKAASQGIEGWVQLSFSITPTGAVDNISIIGAEPKRIFNRAARRALAKWKYKPTVVDGVPVSQPNMNVLLTFKLDGEGDT